MFKVGNGDSRADTLVILNAASGGQQQSAAAEQLRSLGKNLAFACDIVIAKSDAIRQIARNARDSGYQRVIVGGGDGSINAVASELANSNIIMGVLPLGTFNYFARELNVPLDLQQSFEICSRCEVEELTTGEVNGQIFLNNASIGFYPHVLSVREDTYKRFGRSKLVAYASVLLALGRWRLNKRLTLEIDGELHTVRTPMVFIARNASQLEEFSLVGPTCIDKDGLVVYVLPPVGRLGLLKLAWRVFRRRVQPFVDVQVFCARSITIRSNRRTVNVAIDGERFSMTYPLKIVARPKSLKVIVPPQATGDAAA